ncbi:hypothetical protein J7T55_002151 [Diaporthe amygdali]|uniref:uncharacterized protein n=1 Tax=Phomopsis amygdali TaxID=1214568 RepID=UPI0022FE2309|nr:uncharacterized protein J7T55_002151 [Diaporthe amygdali]KAJ0108547.1 hypothetical protein J7T55_002151 [Diaporthe amygdali]
MAKDGRSISPGLDTNVLAALPVGGEVVSVTPSGLSDFCETYRIEVALPGQITSVFFQKVSKGRAGLDLIRAVWASETAINGVIPEFTPHPLSIGAYKSDSNTHFFLADFIDMVEDVIPEPEKYMAPVVALHSRTMGRSPNGRFGFHTSTAYGDLLQDNTWETSWEAFWARIMRQAFETEEQICGPHDERLRTLKAAWFDSVLPRYLHPLESDGRSVTPCLVHADLWPGNCKYTLDRDSVCVYDANAFWGHNEGTSFILLLNMLVITKVLS